MKKKRKWITPIIVIAALAAAFLIYTGINYDADADALAALKTDGAAAVERTGYGWFFDGPSEDDVFVFYPGAKVDEKAYAPLLHRLAGQGMDVCLVKMPFRLAFLGSDKADDLSITKNYENRYIGGHSLGGAMAANYASEHGGQWSGVILLAAYPTKPLDEELLLLSVRGSEDGILNPENLSDGRKYAPNQYIEHVIEGGNHAYFGNYGQQKGDGRALVSAKEQQEETVEFILSETARR